MSQFENLCGDYILCLDRIEKCQRTLARFGDQWEEYLDDAVLDLEQVTKALDGVELVPAYQEWVDEFGCSGCGGLGICYLGCPK